MFSQGRFIIVGMLLGLHLLSGMRYSWDGKESIHRVLYYFRMIESHIFAAMPLVYYKTVHSQPKKLRRMLTAIFRNYTLTQPWSSGRTVHQLTKYFYYFHAQILIILPFL